MAAKNGTPTEPTREELKKRRRKVKARLELAKLETLESALWDGFGGTDLWMSLRERYGDSNGVGWVPISVVGDRRKGQNWPLWRTEQELGELRQKSRIVCQSNDPARCLLGNIQNHIVGKGFTYKAQPKKDLDTSPTQPGVQAPAPAKAVVNAVQKFVDRFLAVNRWTSSINPSLLTSAGVCCREREACRRVYRDGEAFLREFRVDDGMTYVRFVEPEQVTQNGGHNLHASDGWSFGIQHAMEPFEDEERTVAFHVAYKSNDDGQPVEGDIVQADDMSHIKLPDEDAAVKRGTPAFSFDMLDNLVQGSKLLRNTSVASAIQAATAEIWQHEQGSQAQLQSIATNLGERTFPNPVTQKTETTERIRPGQIRHIPKGQTPLWPQINGKQDLIAVVQANLRSASSSVVAPEYFTGDASNANFSSTKEAGTPFTIAAEVVQTHFGIAFASVVWRAIAHAVRCGKLPPEALTVVELQVEPTAVPPTDPLQAAQENQIYTSIKVKSRQTCQMELGLDPDHEDANIEEDEAKFGMGGAGGANPLAGMMDEGGGAPQPQGGQDLAAILGESLLEDVSTGKFTGIDAIGRKIKGRREFMDRTQIHGFDGTASKPQTAPAEKPASNPQDAIADKVKTLAEIIERHYTAAKHPNPKTAAGYTVKDILNMYKYQPQHLAQLLDEEIADYLRHEKRSQ